MILCLVLSVYLASQAPAQQAKPRPKIQKLLDAALTLPLKEEPDALAKVAKAALAADDPVGYDQALIRFLGQEDMLGYINAPYDFFHDQMAIAAKASNPLLGATANEAMGLYLLGINKSKQALRLFEAALKERTTLHDLYGQEESLVDIGEAYRNLDQPSEAIGSYKQALPITRKTLDPDNKIRCLDGMALAYKTLGRNSNALECLESALDTEKRVGYQEVEPDTLCDIGGIYADWGQEPKALDFYGRALLIQRKTGDLQQAAKILTNFGVVYSNIGQYDKALECYQQALPIAQKIGNLYTEALLWSNGGVAYSELGQTSDSLAYSEHALSIQREIGDRTGEARSLRHMGDCYLDLGDKDKALELYREALPIVRDAGDVEGEAINLVDIGAFYNKEGQEAKALEYYAQALPIERKVGDRSTEADTLDNIAVAYRDLGNRSIEILVLKQMVNVFQSLRQDISTLPRSLQDGYRDKVAGAYRGLANELIVQGRITEAETVLDLLKDEDRFEFLRRDAKAATFSQKLEYTGREEGWYDRWKAIEDRAVQVDDTVAQLKEAEASAQRSGTPFADEAKLNQALADQQVAENAVKAYFDVLQGEAAGAQTEDQNQQKQEMESFRDTIGEPLGRLQRDTGEKVAAVYGLVLGDIAHFIVATPEGQVPITVQVTEAKLNQAVAELRDALRNPKLDPKGPGQRLFDLVLAKPVQQLRQAGIHHVMWCLDGSLRTVPLAAVWDGKEYLVQSESYTIYSPLEMQKLDAERNAKPELAAFAASQGGTIGDEYFPPLRGAKTEVNGVVDDPKAHSAGVMPGVEWVDSNFTSKVFLSQMGSDYFAISHIASHFDLSTDYAKSALLTGDGKLLSLKEMLGDSTSIDEAMKKKPWSHLDLVVLSACDTANSTGSAEESFASVVLGLGASSVMASLWSVEDSSTSELMQRFYRNWKSGMNKEEALRRAQISLLTGGGPAGGGATRSRSVSQAPAVKDFSHPYYWAPFQIYGNWR
jgi:CHAT domain-containing protein/tetratricopeptide (TPR) repeat protein